MARKTALSPRKDSKQSRSRTTVQSILEAATQLLGQLDFDSTTTNKIAERAGVSIGSYYQYFPNKESLMAQLIDREVKSYTSQLENLFDRNRHLDLESLISLVIENLCRQFLKQKKMARIFIRLSSHLQKTELVREARQQVADKLTDLITDQDPGAWSKTKSFVLINAVMGVMYSYIQSEENFSEADLKAEMAQLVRGYIIPRPRGKKI